MLAQFAVAADGSLSALAPAALGFGAQDIAITPDGRFAYVTRSAGTDAGAIDRYVRGAGGRMEPAGSIATSSDPRGILVNPQGTRVFYALGARAVQSRPIGADGALGAAANTTIAGTPRFLAMTPSGTSLYVADASRAARAAVRRRPRDRGADAEGPGLRGVAGRRRPARRPTARPRG